MKKPDVNELQKKLKIENLTNCMNCRRFVRCKVPFKEDVVDCGHHFLEEPQSKQVVVVKLCEWVNRE
jgi:hypothetical protein